MLRTFSNPLYEMKCIWLKAIYNTL